MRKFFILVAIAVCAVLAGCVSLNENRDHYTVAIAWRDDTKSDAYKRLVSFFEMAGCQVINLEKTVSPDLEYYESGALSDDYLNFDFSLTDEASAMLWNADKIIVDEKIWDIDLLVFSGGEDISPSLYRSGYEPGFDYMYNPERDASDFLLMRYAISNDIPTLGICRGMQMLAVASGLKLIEDIPSAYPELEGVHRPADGKYSFHSVDITACDSILNSLVPAERLNEVASSHHQAVMFEPGYNLIDTAYTGPIVEVIERSDKSFIIGIQYHPEYYSTHQDMEGLDDAVYFINKLKAF